MALKTENKTVVTNLENADEAPSLEYKFATTTTLHGIGRAAESRGVGGKLPWILVLLVAGGVFVFVMVDRIQTYRKFEANTNVDVTFHDALQFPAVTVCNYNRFMKSKVTADDEKYVKHLLELNDGLSDYNDYDDDLNFTAIEEIFPDDFNYTAFALATGFSLKESLRWCYWKGEAYACDASNFSSHYSPTYGRCYTFNTLGENLKQSQQGIGNGLRLIIDIQQPQYTETFDSGHTDAGLKFAIHPPDELPLLETMGLSAAPGFHTYVSLRQIHHLNLPGPWGVCSTDRTAEDEKYSRNTCLRNCRRDVIIRKCGCQPLGYEHLSAPGVGGVSVCNIDKFQCVQAALEAHRASSSASDCDCPVACDYVTYDSMLSMASFPSSSVAQGFVKLSESLPNGTITVTVDEEYVERNLVYLDVYFNELSTITYTQVEAIPFTALLGDLGGQLGLFLGASVITGAEVLEYVMQRLKILIKKGKARKRVQCLEQ